jgi:hypothetical protein
MQRKRSPARAASPDIGRRRALRQGSPGRGRLSTSDAAALPRPEELILWSDPTWTAKEQQDVTEAVQWLVQATEAVATAGDPVAQLNKQIRAVERRVQSSSKDREHAKIGDLFSSIDTDGSGRLEWDEVLEGATKLGVKGKAGQEQLRVLFSQVADEWREVDRRQFEYLLVSLRAAQEYGGSYVFEVSEVVNAIRGELAVLDSHTPSVAARGKVRYATTTSTAGNSRATGKYARAPEATQHRDSFAVMCTASQKICRLAHHGDVRARQRRQTYIGEQGAVALLTRVLVLDDYDCVFWAAQALIALVEQNRDNADIFEDIGGVRIISDLLTGQPAKPKPVIPTLPLGGTTSGALPPRPCRPLPAASSRLLVLHPADSKTLPAR